MIYGGGTGPKSSSRLKRYTQVYFTRGLTCKRVAKCGVRERGILRTVSRSVRVGAILDQIHDA